jgi:hypothetical protein
LPLARSWFCCLRQLSIKYSRLTRPGPGGNLQRRGNRTRQAYILLYARQRGLSISLPLQGGGRASCNDSIAD